VSELETPAAGRLPVSAWVLGWLFLADQLVGLVQRGLSRSDAVWVVLSVVLTAVVVRWFAAGILRARTGRLVVVWVLLALVLLFSLLGGDLLATTFAAAQIAALGVFSSTDYFRRQRSRHDATGRQLRALLAIAVVVGILGGITASADGDDAPMHLRIGL
jgi:hypothetical protein